MISEKHKKNCADLNYVEHLHILVSTVTGRISISALTSVVGIIVGITSAALAIKICAITAGIWKYKSII